MKSSKHIVQAIMFFLVSILLIVGCDEDNKLESEIAQIPVDYEIERFEQIFENTTQEQLSDIRELYPFLLNERISDSLVLAKQKDSLQQQLFHEVREEFDNLVDIEDKLTGLFQHIKYYDKTFSPPRVITLTDDVNYRNKTIVTDSIVLIGLDTYLGSDHEFYANIPKYITQNMKREQIVSDLASQYAQNYIFQSDRKTLLDEMVYFGKQLYFKDKVIPFEPESVRIGYTEDQMEWAKVNEFQIWSYFIEKEMLYSTDSSLPNRFITPAPFSKFYLQLDNEAPGRLGQYIGWQMVRSFMENNDVPLLKMMELDAEDIFNKSKYKPNK